MDSLKEKFIIVDFSTLQEADFPYINFKELELDEQWGLPARNGQIYINKRIEDATQFLMPLLNFLMENSTAELNRFEKRCKRKYRGLSFDNLTEFIEREDDKKIAEAVGYLLVPMERKRRVLEEIYCE